MEVIKERIQEAKDNLSVSTNDRDYDLFVKGMIRAYNELLSIQFSEGEKEPDEV
jgi:hypothetical protein